MPIPRVASTTWTSASRWRAKVGSSPATFLTHDQRVTSLHLRGTNVRNDGEATTKHTKSTKNYATAFLGGTALAMTISFSKVSLTLKKSAAIVVDSARDALRALRVLR